MKIPNSKKYHTADAMHAAMREYANYCSKPSITACVEYSDGSIDDNFHTFNPAKKTVSYKTPDRESYEQTVDKIKYCGDFLFDFEQLTKKQLVTKLTGYINSLGECDVKVKSVWLKECK